jgi:ATP-dependent protease Clp ATPase subunit
MQPMFDAPDKDDLAEIIIDADVVRGTKAPVEKLKEAKKAA